MGYEPNSKKEKKYLPFHLLIKEALDAIAWRGEEVFFFSFELVRNWYKLGLTKAI